MAFESNKILKMQSIGVVMNRTPVSSSNLAEVGYNPDKEILEIKFEDGGVYRYFNVPMEVYESLMSAKSHGSFFHSNIRGIYDYKQIR